MLQEKDIRYDLIDAILGHEVGIFILYLTARSVLEAKKNKADFKENIEALSRVINIATKSESQWGN